MAHAPDFVPKVRERVELTLSEHTRGGQVRLFGWAPMVPSRFGNRYACGHAREAGRDLVVSGGTGCSILPVRLGMVPEITLAALSSRPACPGGTPGLRPGALGSEALLQRLALGADLVELGLFLRITQKGPGKGVLGQRHDLLFGQA